MYDDYMYNLKKKSSSKCMLFHKSAAEIETNYTINKIIFVSALTLDITFHQRSNLSQMVDWTNLDANERPNKSTDKRDNEPTQ